MRTARCADMLRVLLVLLLLVAAACTSSEPSSTTTQASPPIPASTNVDPATTTAPEAKQTQEEQRLQFDMKAFLDSRFDGVFGDEAASMSVVVIAPASAALEVEGFLTRLAELEGYSFVDSPAIRMSADSFADANGFDRLVGEWVGFGLIPRFDDAPAATWVEMLESMTGVSAMAIDSEQRTLEIPNAWQVVAELPFGMQSGAVVEGVDRGLVVLRSNASLLIRSDGTWEEFAVSPIPVQAACCGGADGIPAGSALVVVDEFLPETWILTPELEWQRAEPRPHTGFVLGSAVIDGRLFVVTAAGRTGAVSSELASLDVDAGTWTALDPVPSPISVGGVTSDGDTLIVGGVQQGPNNNIIGGRSPVIYEYSPGEGWSELTTAPIDGQASTVAWVEGVGLLAWNYDLKSSVFSSGEWGDLMDVPMQPGECYPQTSAGPGGLLALYCGLVAWFDAGSGSWTAIDTPFETRFGVIDDQLVGLVASRRNTTTLIRLSLPPS